MLSEFEAKYQEVKLTNQSPSSYHDNLAAISSFIAAIHCSIGQITLRFIQLAYKLTFADQIS